MNNKSFKITLLEKTLKYMSQVVLWRHKPFVIGVTGSVGKTTTKDMIEHVLRNYKKIWVTQKNYNNEIGVPLTVLCVDKHINSVGGVLYVLKKWISAIISSDYPEILIIEMGVDHPGDMEYLLSIVRPDISVLTAVAYAHSEFFESIEDIALEKQKIVTKMKKNGVAIINADDSHVKNVPKKTNVKITTYGMQEKMDFFASDVEVCFRQCDIKGLSFKLNYSGKVIPVRLHNVIATHMIYATLATLAVADAVQINVIEAIHDIANFVASPGRMQLLDGKNDVLIIDDTYNASPRAMEAAIASLGSVPAGKKIAVLGDMLEMGMQCEREHRELASVLMKNNIDYVVLVGKHTLITKEELEKKGWDKKQLVHTLSPADAVIAVKNVLEEGSTVLVKGSQGMRMENVVEQIICNRNEVSRLLCRQDDAWRAKSFMLHDEVCRYTLDG